MSKSLRKLVEEEMPRAFCARNDDGGCAGRLTVEHPFGRKVQARWMFIYLCHRHHLGDLFDKKRNRHLAYQQATLEEIKAAFPKTWKHNELERAYLATLY